MITSGVPAPTSSPGSTSLDDMMPAIGAVTVASLRSFSIEANWYKIKVDDAIQAVDANTTLEQRVFNNDPVACAGVNRGKARYRPRCTDRRRNHCPRTGGTTP